MKSKEIIKRIVAHDAPPRFGFDFHTLSDFYYVASRRDINIPDNPYDAWGKYPKLEALTGFHGETRRDFYGNIYGRFEGKTKGECIRGVIQDWEDYEFSFPEFDPNYGQTVLQQNYAAHEKFVVAGGISLFSTLRDARLLTNALMDTIEYPELVAEFLDRLAEHEASVIRSIAGCGIDGWMICDDMGMQGTTFISPKSFHDLLKPAYQKLANAVHEAGMTMIMHSCGYNYGFMEDLIDAGVDVFQFDQPDAYPAEVLAKEFAHRVTFYSPVDIQKVLPTGDRDLIENRALEMCRMFREAGGGWIAKDYPSYEDIGVEKEWAGWAQAVIMENSAL